MILGKEDFGTNFIWGVSTAAYQIEGGHNAHNKGASIWDTFVQQKGKIHNKESGDITCDFYNNYINDIRLLKYLNIPSFRLSISWSRIFPSGIAPANQEGVDFYNKVIDFCLQLGITPWVTLYHWDLPQQLQTKGGWTNREIINWFSDYVAFCISTFGDKVKHWMVLNEPMVFTGAGYFLGIHAPGKKGLKNFIPAAHHATLCQAIGGKIIKSINPNCKVGTTFSCSDIHPYQPTEKNIEAANRADALVNRLFIEPLLGMGYPIKDLPFLSRIEAFVKPSDEQNMCFDMDFIGIQNYTREIIKHNYFTPYMRAKVIPANKRNVETTEMNWEVYPEAMYNVLKKYGQYSGIKEIIVTENGAAFKENIALEKVNDTQRVKYLNDNIIQILKAKKEGINVNGYFVWTLLDNFEWADGFRPKFGLVHIDFETQKRTIKSSGYWYKNLMNNKIKLENHF